MSDASDRSPAVEAEDPEPSTAETPGWALGPRHLAVVAAGGFFYLLFSYLPLQGADLWGHVVYGEWILEHRSLPEQDPIMPLAEGMPVIDGAWLSEVILAAVERAGGAEWLSRLFALTLLVSLLFLGHALVLAGGSLRLALLGTLAVLALAWGRLTTFRPESFGVLAFAVLLWLIAADGPDPEAGGEPGARRRASAWRRWLGVPVLFAVWANLDGSFVVGLAVLACRFLGRAIDVGWTSRSPRAAVDDPGVRGRLYQLELALAATLINPYGIDLLLHQLSMPASPNLLYMPEWQPLVMKGWSGLVFALSFAVLLAVFRHSRPRVSAVQVLLLAGFGFAAATGVGRMVWYGPIFAWVVVPHLAEMTTRARRSRWPATAAARIAGATRALWSPSPRYTILCATVLAIVFLLSPIGSSVLGRDARPLRQLFGASPLELAGYLAANPPRGQVWNPATWGGWLALQGPDGLRLFATTEVERLPARVWESYLRISGAASGWSRFLDGYRIDTAILNPLDQQALARAMRFSDGWSLTYDDGLAMVFVRAPRPAAGRATGDDAEERGE